MKKTSLIITILIISIGFAAISTTLIINGNTKISENVSDFEIIFTKANLDNTDVYDDVISSDKQTITFTNKYLVSIGDSSTLNYEITNNSNNYDAEVTMNCNVKDGESSEYTSITNSLENNKTIIASKESVSGSLTITLDKVSVEEITEKYTCTLEFNAVERENLGVNIPEPVSFASDSWETIQESVRTGNTDMYNVGDTKTVVIAEHSNGSKTIAEQEAVVRLANKEECTGKTSETACGFVLEFESIIEEKGMNTGRINVGGWESSSMRSYLNNIILLSLPSDLQNVIVETKVISGHGGTSGESNFETTDKLYLLSTKEIYGETKNDTVDIETEQLEYYKNNGVTLNDYGVAKKVYNGSGDLWWLRSAYSYYDLAFMSVSSSGSPLSSYANYSNGISPAFRIA